MAYQYVVLGGGLQGTAAAYDFARFGEAQSVVIADYTTRVAEEAAAKVNALMQREVAHPVPIDVRDAAAVEKLLQGKDVCLSAVPYYFNTELTDAAIRAGCHFCDLGGNTTVVFEQHKRNDAARAAGVSVLPDCGLAPGMANILAAHGIRRLKHPRKAYIRVGGLPQNPKPPLGYSLSFSIEGLTNEYFGKAFVLRRGEITQVEAFSELESIEFPDPVGPCEAFMTVGGTSTCPWTFAGVLEEFDEKTVRYPGHYDKMRAIYELGLLDNKPVQVKGVTVVPRDVFHAVAGPVLEDEDPQDVVVLRVTVKGDDGEMVMELVDFYDSDTGFTAMQRTTGFGAAIVGIMQARGEFQPGCQRLEETVDTEKYIAAMRERGFELEIKP